METAEQSANQTNSNGDLKASVTSARIEINTVDP